MENQINVDGMWHQFFMLYTAPSLKGQRNGYKGKFMNFQDCGTPEVNFISQIELVLDL